MAAATKPVMRKEDIARYRQYVAVTEEYCRGTPLHEIAIKTNLTVQQVGQKLKEVRDGWATKVLGDYDQKVAAELMKIDNLEKESWAAWFRSCNDEITVSTTDNKALRTLKDRQKATKSQLPVVPKLTTVTTQTRKNVKSQVGHPAFLGLVQWCIETRVKLLGLAPEEGDGKKTSLVDWSRMYDPRPVVYLDPADVKILELEGAPNDNDRPVSQG